MDTQQPEVLRTGPLCYGQLLIWNAISRLDDVNFSVMIFQDLWTLPAGIDEDQVAHSWNAIVARHEALRTIYQPGDTAKEATQIVLSSAIQDIASMRLNEGQDWQEIVLREASRLHEDGFNSVEENCWKATLISVGNKPKALCFICHHLMTDIHGVAQLRKEFLALLSGADSKEWPPPLQPCDRAHAERSKSWYSRRQAVAAYLENTAHEATRLADSTANDDASLRNLDLHIYQGVLNTKFSEFQLSSLATQFGVSLPSLVLALMSHITTKIANVPWLVVQLITSNRFESLTRGLVSSLAQPVPIVLDTSETQSLDALARLVHSLCVKAYRNSSYHPDLSPSFHDSLPQSTIIGGFQHRPFPLISTIENSNWVDLGENSYQPAPVRNITTANQWPGNTKLTGWNIISAINNERLSFTITVQSTLETDVAQSVAKSLCAHIETLAFASSSPA